MATPVSTLQCLTILPKSKVNIEPHFKVVLHMMYGDADLYEDVVLFTAKPDGSPNEKWLAECLKEDYGRDANIYDALAIADSITGNYDECFIKHSGSPDYVTTYAHMHILQWKLGLTM
jgi:hypothetical protein